MWKKMPVSQGWSGCTLQLLNPVPLLAEAQLHTGVSHALLHWSTCLSYCILMGSCTGWTKMDL